MLLRKLRAVTKDREHYNLLLGKLSCTWTDVFPYFFRFVFFVIGHLYFLASLFWDVLKGRERGGGGGGGGGGGRVGDQCISFRS